MCLMICYFEYSLSLFQTALHGLQSDYSAHSHGLSRSRSISPETAEAARILARIGDEVQQRYFAHLDRAVGRLVLASCAGLFTYENFREAALMVLDKDLSEWRQVGLHVTVRFALCHHFSFTFSLILCFILLGFVLLFFQFLFVCSFNLLYPGACLLEGLFQLFVFSAVHVLVTASVHTVGFSFLQLFG